MAARLAPDARSLFKTAGAKARTSRSPPGSPAARCPGGTSRHRPTSAALRRNRPSRTHEASQAGAGWVIRRALLPVRDPKGERDRHFGATGPWSVRALGGMTGQA